MTSRERVLTTLAHKEPDRIPYNLRPSDEMRERLRRDQNDPSIDLAEFFNQDVRYVTLAMPDRPANIPIRDWTPPPAREAIAACAQETKALKARGLATCGSYFMGVYEEAKEWFGDVEALTMPYEDPDKLNRELDRITEWKMSVYGGYAQAGTDIVWIGDDLGMQENLIMSPESYREWYKPRHKRIVDHLRSILPDVHVAFHCCGFVTTLIPDLIDVGIDILEAVQAECMDIAHLKKEFGKDISFWGGVGAQSVLARTTPEQVIEGVRKTLSIMSPGGGYIAAPCHTLTEEVAWESVIAFHEAMQTYGDYPCPGTERLFMRNSEESLAMAV